MPRNWLIKTKFWSRHLAIPLLCRGGGVGASHRLHKPLVITKTIDKSSPLLNNALCSGEVLKTCRLEIYRTSASGTQERFYIIDLSDAIIIAIDLIMPHCQDLNSAHFTQMEKVHFVYQSIIWTHVTGGTIGMDEWQGEQG